MKLNAKNTRPAAFTIIEIMTAMVVFGMIIAAIFETWQAVTRGSVSGNRAAAAVQRSRVAVRTIEEALGSTRSFVADVQYYTFDAENGTEPYMSFVARLSPEFLRSGRFNGFDVRRVTFSVEQGPDRMKQLLMRQTPVLMDMDNQEQNHPLVLANDVRKFGMQFWDKRQTDWLDEWDQTNQLPQMVKFTIQLGNGNPDSPPFDEITRIVALPSVAVQPNWQAPGVAGGINGPLGSGANGFNGGGIKFKLPGH
jgi:hypothetical protein